MNGPDNRVGHALSVNLPKIASALTNIASELKEMRQMMEQLSERCEHCGGIEGEHLLVCPTIEGD